MKEELLKAVYEFAEELTEENENLIFFHACEIAKHLDIIKVGSRYFRMYFGSEHDSWEDVTEEIKEK